MKHSRMTRAGGILALVASAATVLVAGAHAGKLFSAPIDETDSHIEEDFCGVEGLTVGFATHTVGRVQAVPHGRDQLPYFGFNLKVTDVITNLANGSDVVAESTIRDKDLRVTDNGDGTLTIVGQGVGNFVVSGSDSPVVLRDTGMTRVEVLIDNAGTPTDPFDDEFLEFVGIVKESTGRNDLGDFCDDLLMIAG